MARALILAVVFALCGCSVAEIKDTATSTDTFLACKTADVVTTAVALNSGKFHEANPLLKPLIGPHNFFPLILFSIAAYEFLKWADSPTATAVANVATCGVAANNARLLLRAR